MRGSVIVGAPLTEAGGRSLMNRLGWPAGETTSLTGTITKPTPWVYVMWRLTQLGVPLFELAAFVGSSSRPETMTWRTQGAAAGAQLAASVKVYRSVVTSGK